MPSLFHTTSHFRKIPNMIPVAIPSLSLLQLLLHSQMVGVTALLLPAVGSTGMETSITFTADHFVAVVLLGQQPQRRFNHTTSQPQHQVESRLLLDVVVAQCASVFQLFTGEDETLLVWWDSLFVLDFGLDVVYGVAGFHLEGDGLAGEGFHEDLHDAGLIFLFLT